MFGSYRGIVVAIGIALFTHSGQAQDQANDPQGEPKAKEQSASQLPIPIPVQIIKDDETASARERHEEESRQNQKADLAAQQGMNAATQAMNEATQRMAFYALWSTGFVGVGTCLLIWTLWLTRQANKAAQSVISVTRDIGEAQSRAYLAARAGKIRLDTSTGGVNFTVEVFNFGNSPATDIKFYGLWGLGPRDLDFPRKDILRPPKKISEIPVSLFRELRGYISVGTLEPEFSNIIDGNVYFFVAGVLTYRDVFNKRQRIKIAVSGHTEDSLPDDAGYVEADLKPTNPGVWDQTGNADHA